jgi:hypothetical protein
MIEFLSKWQDFSPKGSNVEVSKVSEGAFETFDTSIAEALSEKFLLPAPAPLLPASLVVALTTRCAPVASTRGTARTVVVAASVHLRAGRCTNRMN